VAGQSYGAGPDGRASFRLVFDEKNYNQPTPVEVWQGERPLAHLRVEFFTETRLKVIVP